MGPVQTRRHRRGCTIQGNHPKGAHRKSVCTTTRTTKLENSLRALFSLGTPHSNIEHRMMVLSVFASTTLAYLKAMRLLNFWQNQPSIRPVINMSHTH